MQLSSLPTFKPRFIPLVTVLQMAVIFWMLFDSYKKQQFAKVGMSVSKTTCSIETGFSPECPQNFRGFVDAAAVSEESVNPWIGPDTDYLIYFAGKFAPCMRSDRTIQGTLAKQRQMECGTSVAECDDPNIVGGEGFSCCAGTCRNNMGDRLCTESSVSVSFPRCSRIYGWQTEYKGTLYCWVSLNIVF